MGKEKKEKRRTYDEGGGSPAAEFGSEDWAAIVIDSTLHRLIQQRSLHFGVGMWRQNRSRNWTDDSISESGRSFITSSLHHDPYEIIVSATMLACD